MSDTPQTDAAQRWFPMAANVGAHVVDADFARKLELQRDEARGWAEAAWAKSDRAEKMLRIAAAKADEAQADYERVCRALAAAKADQWRECAEVLARLLRQRIDHDDDVFLDWEADQLAVFDRLKKEAKK